MKMVMMTVIGRRMEKEQSKGGKKEGREEKRMEGRKKE